MLAARVCESDHRCYQVKAAAVDLLIISGQRRKEIIACIQRELTREDEGPRPMRRLFLLKTASYLLTSGQMDQVFLRFWLKSSEEALEAVVRAFSESADLTNLSPETKLDAWKSLSELFCSAGCDSELILPLLRSLPALVPTSHSDSKKLVFRKCLDVLESSINGEEKAASIKLCGILVAEVRQVMPLRRPSY